MGKWKPRAGRSRAATSDALDGAERAAANAVAALATIGTTAKPRRTPGDRVPASAIIVRLMDAVRRNIHIPPEVKPMETLALLCASAWNASRLSSHGEDARAEVAEARRNVAAMDPAFAPMFDALLAMSQTMYPDDRRLVMSVTVDFAGGKMRVNAASMGGDE